MQCWLVSRCSRYRTILTYLGVAVPKPAVEMTKEDFDQQMVPNVWGCFTVAQAAVK
jgi:NAD(P)-dependent dehydrogenase (short-subunit alcohol dehydrogenase family)